MIVSIFEALPFSYASYLSKRALVLNYPEDTQLN